MAKIKTMIIGATTNPARYSYLVAHKLVRKGYEIVNVGIKVGKVAGVPIENLSTVHTDIDTITLYLKAENQKQYYDYIVATKPRRLIFNPGAENIELKELAEQNGIQCIEACTLVLINTGQY